MERKLAIWDQEGFAVISDAGPMLMFHDFKLTDWEAKDVVASAERTLPEHLRQNLRVVPATIHFES